MQTGPRWETEALGALAQQLEESSAHFELVVIGGSALVALGLVARATKDVDVVGILSTGELHSADPLPESDLGLPAGFLDRVHRVDVAPSLAVLYADRFDQIHFKLYAMVDQGGGRHEDDLRSLAPTGDELQSAASWTRTHDPSPGFREQLLLALQQLGADDVAVE